MAATDYIRMFADQIRPFVRQRYRVLGTDGFGRSDYRKKLRHFFEVDRHWVTLAALESLALDGARARSQGRRGDQQVRHRPGQAEPGQGLTAAGSSNGMESVPAVQAGQGEEAPMAIEVKVPDIGDFKDVPVIEIHVKPGDSIKADDPLVTLESDKATMDVPADRDGTVEAVLIKVGDRVSEGSRGHHAQGRRRRGAGDAAALGDRPAGAGAGTQADLRPAGSARRRSRPPPTPAWSMPARACAASPASSRSTSPRSRAPARRAGSPRTT